MKRSIAYFLSHRTNCNTFHTSVDNTFRNKGNIFLEEDATSSEIDFDALENTRAFEYYYLGTEEET